MSDLRLSVIEYDYGDGQTEYKALIKTGRCWRTFQRRGTFQEALADASSAIRVGVRDGFEVAFDGVQPAMTYGYIKGWEARGDGLAMACDANRVSLAADMAGVRGPKPDVVDRVNLHEGAAVLLHVAAGFRGKDEAAVMRARAQYHSRQAIDLRPQFSYSDDPGLPQADQDTWHIAQANAHKRNAEDPGVDIVRRERHVEAAACHVEASQAAADAWEQVLEMDADVRRVANKAYCAACFKANMASQKAFSM